MRIAEQMRGILRLLFAATILHASPAVSADPARSTVIEDDDEDDGPSVSSKPTSPKTMTETLFSPLLASGWRVEFGTRALAVPKVLGDNAIQASLGFTYNIIWNDTVFLTSERGLGINAFQARGVFGQADRFVAGIAANYDDRAGIARSQSQLRSLDVRQRNAVHALGFAEYRNSNWRVWSEVSSYIDRRNGHVFSLGSEYAIPVTNKWTFLLSGGLSYSDAAHMRETYGIPAAAAVQFGASPYRLSAGFSDASLSAQIEYKADNHWTWSLTAGETFLLGQAAKSPRVETRSQPFMSAAVKYKF